jgi:cyclopropane fatty-acyl-phospholipid synthase-like methyltransferase
MNDYLATEYDTKKRPLSTYPEKRAKHLFDKFKMQPGESILEIGAGRCELLSGFKKLGLNCYAIDSKKITINRKNLMAALEYENDDQKRFIEESISIGHQIFKDVFGFNSSTFIDNKLNIFELLISLKI